MYQISRSIYRRLAPRVIIDPADPTGSRNRLRVLRACEAVMERMAENSLAEPQSRATAALARNAD